MEFSFAPQEEAFRAELRRFLDEEVSGEPGPLSEEAYYPLARRVRKGLGSRGWLALGWPQEYGGEGTSWIKDLILQEELAYHGVPRGNDHAPTWPDP